jgi:hypothetical protein
MNLFNYKNKVIKNRKICNNFFQDKIITDLGEILVECFFYKNNFQFDIKYFNNFTHFSLVNPYLTIECLNTEIIENNEDLLDYGIENTKLWIFRIISKEINQDVKLKISFIEKVSCEIESGGDQGYVKTTSTSSF